MAISPTQRTLAECKRRGWECQVVEKWIPQARRRVDLFGVIDIVVLTDTGILGIQATSGSNHSARVAKILEEPRALKWLKVGGFIQVWSWAKRGARCEVKRWTLREETVSL